MSCLLIFISNFIKIPVYFEKEAKKRKKIKSTACSPSRLALDFEDFFFLFSRLLRVPFALCLKLDDILSCRAHISITLSSSPYEYIAPKWKQTPLVYFNDTRNENWRIIMAFGRQKRKKSSSSHTKRTAQTRVRVSFTFTCLSFKSFDAFWSRLFIPKQGDCCDCESIQSEDARRLKVMKSTLTILWGFDVCREGVEAEIKNQFSRERTLTGAFDVWFSTYSLTMPTHARLKFRMHCAFFSATKSRNSNSLGSGLFLSKVINITVAAPSCLCNKLSWGFFFINYSIIKRKTSSVIRR